MALDLETIKAGFGKLPRYQKGLIIGVAFVILIGLYVYLMFMPKQVELDGLQKKLSGLQTKLSQSKAVASDLPRFEAEFAELKEKLALALIPLPSSDEIPKLLKDMESLGNDAGIRFQSLKLLDDIPKGFYAEVPVDLKLAGGYHDMGVFFDKLSHLPRIVNISKVSIGSPKNVGGKIELAISCRATTFKFLEGK